MYELMTRLRHPIVSAHPQTPQINQIRLNIKHNCKTRHRYPIVSALPQTPQLNKIKLNSKHKCKTRHRHPTVSARPQPSPHRVSSSLLSCWLQYRQATLIIVKVIKIIFFNHDYHVICLVGCSAGKGRRAQNEYYKDF